MTDSHNTSSPRAVHINSRDKDSDRFSSQELSESGSRQLTGPRLVTDSHNTSFPRAVHANSRTNTLRQIPITRALRERFTPTHESKTRNRFSLHELSESGSRQLTRPRLVTDSHYTSSPRAVHTNSRDHALCSHGGEC